MNNYVVYHLHTELSLLDSCTNYKDYVDMAKELNQKAICFTEHGNTYNWIDKKMYCDKNEIKYIHGVEMYLTETLDDKIRDNYHTILISRNYEGFKELNRLVDLSTQESHMYYKNRITFDEFLNISDNIIKISACLASPIARLPERIKSEESDIARIQEESIGLDDESLLEIKYKTRILEQKICILKKYNEEIIQKYDYLEIQPHVRSKDQIEYNKYIYELSVKYNKPIIAGTDTHAINKYKQECRAIKQKAKKINYSDEDEFDLTYKSYEEVCEMFKNQNSVPEHIYLEAINNTNVMAESVEEFELDMSFKYPILYGSAENDTKIFKKRISEMFSDKVSRGVIDRSKISIYKQKIKEEFKVFDKLGMNGFMLFMSELLTWCNENNIPYGYCRGSVGGSRVAYVLDIIDLDPEFWNTVFSRFCNVHRQEIGDIDCDFSPSQRQLVYDYIINRFGTDYTAYILAIGTVSDKGTIDEICRALSYKWVENNVENKQEVVDAKKYLIECRKNSPQAMESAEKNLINVMEKYDDANPYSISKTKIVKEKYDLDKERTRLEYPDIFYYFDGIYGSCNSQSMHPAGIVASPITLTDNYGTFNKDGFKILSINMEEIHEVSLVKYDILGLKNIEIIKDCCELVGLKYPKSYQLNWQDDNAWNDMITSQVGIFQFEGDYAFKLLKDFNPHKINDMSLVNASLRPSGESYRDRLISGEFNKNPSEQIDELLADNNGFLVFQEDTTKFLTDICDFEGSDADNVRRAIGRKDEERLKSALPKILEGYCSKSDKPREVSEQEALEFLKIIEDSSRYQFGYNHSTGYSMIGYTCAYYRYYYPLEFITAYLNNAGNEDDIKNGTMLADAKGIKIRPVKFRYSKSKYTPDKGTNSIFKGMSSIKFLNENISNELYSLRDNKYDSFIDLLIDIKEKTSLNSRQLYILVALSYFSEFGKSKKLLDIVIVFDKIYSRKQIKISDLEKYEVGADLILKYASTKTEKMVKDIDTYSILKEYETVVEDKDLSIKEKISIEQEYMGYIEYKNAKASKNIYYVSDFKVYKDKAKPYLELYQIRTGNILKAKITAPTLFMQYQFNKGNILVIEEFKRRPKTKMIDGKWVKSNTEFDNILESYEVY